MIEAMSEPNINPSKRLYRAREGRVVAGVCARRQQHGEERNPEQARQVEHVGDTHKLTSYNLSHRAVPSPQGAWRVESNSAGRTPQLLSPSPNCWPREREKWVPEFPT